LARGTFSSDAFIGAINATNPANPFTPSYAVVDLFASYELSENFTLAAKRQRPVRGLPWALTLPPTVHPHPIRGHALHAGLGRTVMFMARCRSSKGTPPSRIWC
jgi:hypothetical protein